MEKKKINQSTLRFSSLFVFLSSLFFLFVYYLLIPYLLIYLGRYLDRYLAGFFFFWLIVEGYKELHRLGR